MNILTFNGLKKKGTETDQVPTFHFKMKKSPSLVLFCDHHIVTVGGADAALHKTLPYGHKTMMALVRQCDHAATCSKILNI